MQVKNQEMFSPGAKKPPKKGVTRRELGRTIVGERQAGLIALLDKACNDRQSCAQKPFDLARAAIAGANPNNFRRVASEYAPLLKIRIPGHDCETVLFGVSPNGIIACTSHLASMHVSAVRIQGCQNAGQTRREIFVEKELHAREISTLRSRSAANARQAWISSFVRYGKSRRTSS